MALPDPFRIVLAELAAADAELAAEALASYADAGRDAARRHVETGDEDAAETVETQVSALDRASSALRAALSQDRSA